jgi:transcriptional regulator with XRE-family HTH domain
MALTVSGRTDCAPYPCCMPTGATGASNDFSRAIARAVDLVREESGLTTHVLLQRARMSKNYYYRRARGEAPFNTNDLSVLAGAMGVGLSRIWALAVSDAEEPTGSTDEPPSPHVLAERLRKLVIVGQSQSRTGDVEGDLLASVAARTAHLTRAHWESLLAGDGARVSREQLAAIANHFNVHPEYLAYNRLNGSMDDLDSRLEIQVALAETGALGVAARRVGDGPTPESRRALAQAIREGQRPKE